MLYSICSGHYEVMYSIRHVPQTSIMIESISGIKKVQYILSLAFLRSMSTKPCNNELMTVKGVSLF